MGVNGAMHNGFAAAMVIALATYVSAGESGDDKQIEQSLIGIERQLAQASVALDPEPYDRYWSDDFVGVTATGARYTKAQHRSSLTSGKLKFESLDIDQLEVHLFGATAVVIERRSVKGHYENKNISGYNRVMGVFIRRDNNWQKAAEYTAPAD